ncbi:MAG: sodium ion-translocating decarboxylase subunit beta, partial [Clostridia bacterium]
MDSGIYALISDPKPLIMLSIACILIYLAIVKKYEPLLLLPIAFGMLLTNLPIAGMYHSELFAGGHTNWNLFGGAVLIQSTDLVNVAQYTITPQGAVLDALGNMLGQVVDTLQSGVTMNAAGALVAADGSTFLSSAGIIINSAGAYLGSNGQVFTVAGQLIANAGQTITAGLLDYLYLGVKLGIYPCLIFLGVGAMTDFGPLIANPKSLLLGAAAQLGIFITFIVCYSVMGFTPQEAASTGIIGGADGPTAIYLTGKLAPHLLGPIAVAAYSYMALVPVIQPPIMRALTTKKEREIVMEQLRPVSKREKIIFPIAV